MGRPEAIDEWANASRERFGSQQIAVCLEQRKGALIHALLKYEHLVLYPVNPQALQKLRRAFSPSGAKDDPTDAELAADILQQHRDKLRLRRSEDSRTRQIQARVEARRRLVEQRVRITNRFTANAQCAERALPMSPAAGTHHQSVHRQPEGPFPAGPGVFRQP